MRLQHVWVQGSDADVGIRECGDVPVLSVLPTQLVFVLPAELLDPARYRVSRPLNSIEIPARAVEDVVPERLLQTQLRSVEIDGAAPDGMGAGVDTVYASHGSGNGAIGRG